MSGTPSLVQVVEGDGAFGESPHHVGSAVAPLESHGDHPGHRLKERGREMQPFVNRYRRSRDLPGQL